LAKSTAFLLAFRRGNQSLLALLLACTGDQCILDFFEGLKHNLMVSDYSLLLPCLLYFDVRAQPASVKRGSVTVGPNEKNRLNPSARPRDSPTVPAPPKLPVSLHRQ